MFEKKTTTMKSSYKMSYSIKRMIVNAYVSLGCCLNMLVIHLCMFLITLKQTNHQTYISSHSKSAAEESHQETIEPA